LDELWVDDRGFESRQELGIDLLTTASWGPTQSPIQWVSGAPFPGCKAAGTWSWPLTYT